MQNNNQQANREKKNDKLTVETLQDFKNDLNYKVLIKLFDIEVSATTRYKDDRYDVGHHYAVLVYISGDMRKHYYQGILKLQSFFDDEKNYQFLSYVVLHLLEDGIHGQYFHNAKDFSQYYQILHKRSIRNDEHSLKVYEGSGAENSDNSILINALHDVLDKKYSKFGSLTGLYFNSWNCRDFIDYLRKKLGR